MELEEYDVKRLLVDYNGNPTPCYQAYMKYRQEYDKKVAEQANAYNQARLSPMKFQMWPIVGKSYSDDVNEALNRWITLGFKNEVEKAINILRSQGVDTNSFS
ncbi:hypothetical protein [Aridibaculum aurantiacum]|uniref:hypothetical protein n=1 Tax=Aridibaculum aurantiacum TaxID=2810307 RepID=UPI001A95FC75|nr:hypothetical protein [Aridibaculum aurantiacum]